MRKTRRIIPYALLSGLLVSCVTDHKLARVRISQPQMKEAVADTGFRLPRQITWTDDKGKEHIVTEATKDSVTGEYITQMELSEITVVAKSKQVAERNGKINLDFIVTVPGELISNKWQLQLAPVAYKPSDTLYLDRIFLSGADFAKMQRKGYMRYQAFINSIIPDSLYLQKLFDGKGYRKALAELEEEYFQAWKHEVLSKERWIDWSDKANARFALFNYRMERNKQAIAGYNSILEYLPAYRLRREMDGKYIPSKWKIFAEGNYKIRTRNITPEDSASITRRFTDYAKMAENRKRKEQAGEMYEKYVRFPYEAARLDTVIKEGDNFVYYYKQELPATENTKKIDLTLDGQILSKDETKTQLPPSDTITYFISSMVQFLDRSPRYKKKIITRKDEVNLRAYVTYKSGATEFLSSPARSGIPVPSPPAGHDSGHGCDAGHRQHLYGCRADDRGQEVQTGSLPCWTIVSTTRQTIIPLSACLMSLGYDARALEIMREQRDTSDRNYLLAILYSRPHGKRRRMPSSHMSGHATRMPARYGADGWTPK